MLRTKISSDLEELDAINAKWNFCPSAEQVRPTPELKEIKAQKLESISNEWKEFVDFIYHDVFECSYIEITLESGESRRTVPNRHRVIRMNRVFKAQMFPYQVSSNHSVMWYPDNTQRKTDEEITLDIETDLKRELNTDTFDFAWYVNPKMTVPEFFHVQVFWTFFE